MAKVTVFNSEMKETDLTDQAIATQTLSVNSRELNPWGESILPQHRKMNDLLRQNGRGSVRSKVMYILNEYQKLQEYIFERFEYTGLEEMDFDKYNIEELLALNGVMYFVKIGGEYFFLRAEVEEYDIYRNPRVIRVQGDTYNNELNGLKFSKGEFVEIRNNFHRSSLFIRAIVLLLAQESVFYALNKNVKLTMPKLIHIGEIDIMKQNMKMAIEEIFESDDTFFNLLVGKNNQRKDINKLISETVDNQLENMFGRLEFEDRTPQLKDMYNIFREMLKEQFGAGINLYADKKERVQGAEVNISQEFSIRMGLHMLNMRREGFNKVNRLFGTNIQVNHLETQQEKNAKLMAMAQAGGLEQNNMGGDDNDDL